jgi:hypothetical protein
MVWSDTQVAKKAGYFEKSLLDRLSLKRGFSLTRQKRTECSIFHSNLIYRMPFFLFIEDKGITMIPLYLSEQQA